MSQQSTASEIDPFRKWVGLLLGYFIPGGGFILCGRWQRGLAHFLTIMVTFSLGIALHGAVVWPTWDRSSEDFNLINNFTFVVQVGTGAPALASLMATTQEKPSESGPMKWLAGDPPHAYYELGAYFLIVAGALNLFALGNYYDRVMHVAQRFVDQESPPPQAKAEGEKQT